MAGPRDPAAKPPAAAVAAAAAASSAAPDISIVGDQVQLFEAPAPSQNETHDRNLVAHMARFRESPFDFLREISLHVSGKDWRSYDNVIGQPIFYPGFTENMKSAVMDSQMLRRKIEDLASSRLNEEDRLGLFMSADGKTIDERKKRQRREEIEGALKDVSDSLLDDMVCKMESKTFIRSAYFLVTSLLTRAYHQGIHVSSEEVLRLRAVAEKAAKNRQSIIFLPCHRSHVDYVSLQLICYRLGLGLPTVVAGDNLNFPVIGPFLQNAGAMWIRRSFGDDVLYSTLVQAYIDTLLAKGFNFECFIEGGRSRIGKLLPPKFGILSFILDSILSGRVKDAIICPVSTQYDKVIEVDSYISELLGTPKVKENLADFLSASSILSLKLGRVDVRFHEPWSLRDFVNVQQKRLQSLTQSQQADLNKAYNQNLRSRLLRTLGYKVLSDINAVSVVMPTSLVGTALLTLRGRGVGKTELNRRVEWLTERVRAQGGRVAHFSGLPTGTVVERALEVLGPKLVGMQNDVAEETYFAVDRFQLSFYRNMTIHLFISQALVSAGMYTKIKAGGPLESQAIAYSELLSEVQFLSRLFRGEFIFRTQGLVANLSQTLAGLEADGVITVKRKAPTAAAKEDEVDIETVELSQSERENGRENYDFYCFLIWPFIEATWLGAISILMLTPPAAEPGQSPAQVPRWLEMNKFLSAAQMLGKTLFAQGDLSYFEAVSKETLKNSHQRFEEEGIIISRKPPKGGRGLPQMVRLADGWEPARIVGADGIHVQARGRLWEFCEEISKSRLEGKNRRDGDAVVGRVLRLVETVGKDLWETGAMTDEKLTAAGVSAEQAAAIAAERAAEERLKKKAKAAAQRARANL